MLFRLQAADGSTVLAMHACSSVRQQVGIVVQSHLIDVTAEKAVEGELRELTQQLEQQVEARTEQLRAAFQNLESFAYSVAHDLRTPVSNAASFATAIHGALANRQVDKALHYASRVVANTSLANEMIDGLLRFSKAGSDQLELAWVCMDYLVADVVEQIGGTAGQVVQVEGSLGHASADRQLLRHVWMNLVANAVKFSAGSAQPRVTVSRREEGEEIVFTVADNGIGFSQEQYDKLFRVFSRLVNQGEFPGTGVGLATVKRIVERHGGSVWAAGEPGAGSRFCFSLPRRSADAPPVRQA
jgi:signal transduction histidine kinase